MSSDLVIRVVVIDDHEMILQSVERMLRDDPQIVVVGTALDATSGIELTRREQPDIVVIDYTLPDMDAPDAIRMLRKVHSSVKVITFSGSGRPGALFASMEAGSRAWIAKTRAIQDLREAIRRVAQNLPVVNVELDQLPPLQELVVYYQPVVSLHNEKVVSFEALIRWQHPERGLLFPDSFLPLAEATGFMVEIDRWVWEQAANQLFKWQRQFPSTPNLRMSVNLSPSDLGEPQLFSFIHDIFDRTGIAANDFIFELTESVLLEDSDMTMDFLMKLKGLGVEIALDDFGTAYSSLSYVQRFPFDRLKLDISFVSELPQSTRSLLLVEEICRMSASMKMRVIAEGIERREQADVLVDIGCEFGQGYLFARPLSAANCTSFIAAHQIAN